MILVSELTVKAAGCLPSCFEQQQQKSVNIISKAQLKSL